MKKMMTVLITLMVLLSFVACQGNDNQANNSGSSSTTDTTVKKDTPTPEPVVSDSDTSVGELIVSVNPNSEETEGSTREADVLAAEKKMILDAAEAVITFMQENGEAKTLTEINKSREGAFKELLPESHHYFGFQKKVDGVWKIVAHGTNTDFVGIDVVIDSWADITGWKYHVELFELAAKANHGWVDNLVWQDPEWADNKKCLSSGYTRVFKLDGEEYWIYFGIWLEA